MDGGCQPWLKWAKWLTCSSMGRSDCTPALLISAMSGSLVLKVTNSTAAAIDSDEVTSRKTVRNPGYVAWSLSASTCLRTPA